ncbi:MAG: gluconeogenesis factor YvcK family protein [Microgenomates group bacterium]
MGKTITVVGGGTGTYVVLQGLKKYFSDLAVIVSMTDSGGSTGRLRDQLGVLPPGDLRQCLIALSEASNLWRQLFLYRFEKGDLAGHNFGNIFLSALEKVFGDYEEVVKIASFVLKTKGEVIPVTFDKVHLCVEYQNGKVIKGEGNIDKNFDEKARIRRAYLEPEAKANPRALQRINESDYIIIAPGDLYTSIIPVFLVKKIKEFFKNSKAKIVFILNLMTKSGQTTGYKASDFLKDIFSYTGRVPNYIIVNNGKIPKDVLNWYEKNNEVPVINDLNKINFRGFVIKKDIIDRKKINFSKEERFIDPRVRSILRHDSLKLAKILAKIIS